MSNLQDMLRVQARLHRKQGANALGDLFENAGKEIEQLAEQLAKANERVEELQDALVDDAKAKAVLNKLAIENGELNIKASGNIFHVFCETFVETFKGSGATNYLVAEFNSEELGAFTVTMQRSEGLTVYQKLNEANERIALLEQVEEIFNESPELTFDNVKGMFSEELNKFAIEKKIEALKELLTRKSHKSVHHLIEIVIDSYENQLRKEQE